MALPHKSFPEQAKCSLAAFNHNPRLYPISSNRTRISINILQIIFQVIQIFNKSKNFWINFVICSMLIVSYLTQLLWDIQWRLCNYQMHCKFIAQQNWMHYSLCIWILLYILSESTYAALPINISKVKQHTRLSHSFICSFIISNISKTWKSKEEMKCFYTRPRKRHFS